MVQLQVWNGTLKKWYPVKTRTYTVPHTVTHKISADISPCASNQPLHTFRTFVSVEATLGGDWDGMSGYAPSQGDPRDFPNGRGVQVRCAIPPLN
ncbi:hypothetical protein [Actinopolymorpha pittospori]